MEAIVYQVAPDRWGYRVDSVVQEWHPNLPGFEPMSKEVATSLAEEQRVRMESGTEPEPRGITKLEFMSRFTDEELVAIYAMAKTIPQIELWLEKVKMATGDVVMSDPRTISGVNGLEALGLIGEGRSREILA